MKRYLAALFALTLAMALASAAVAKTTKADMCHYDAVTDSYALISVSDNGPAVDKHLAHGDGYPGDPVPGMAGYEFDADCLAISVDADGDGVVDLIDNCPDVANPDQLDQYGSPRGDACEDTDADGTPDVNEANICVKVGTATGPLDGAFVLGPIGTATCQVDRSTGLEPNIAVADGDNAYAFARFGANNIATAAGVSAFTEAGYGDNNIATATGDGAVAVARDGNNNLAIANGDLAIAVNQSVGVERGDNNTAIANGVGADARVFRSPGDNNIATATGDGSLAYSGYGNGNTATATGPNAWAAAMYGDGNTATATGAGAHASAQDGNNNTAIANGVAANAYAGSGGDGNTAIAEGDGQIAAATAPSGCTVTNGTCP